MEALHSGHESLQITKPYFAKLLLIIPDFLTVLLLICIPFLKTSSVTFENSQWLIAFSISDRQHEIKPSVPLRHTIHHIRQKPVLFFVIFQERKWRVRVRGRFR